MGDRFDWFFYVNGVESPVGAADYALHGGDSIWWDYRDWSAAEGVPAVVGSWPQPFRDGYEGRRHPVAVECLGGGGACGEVRARLEAAGVSLAKGSPKDAIRVLVGPWGQVREDPAAAQLEAGPQTSGVFAQFTPATPRRRAENGAPAPVLGPSTAEGYVLRGLDEGGGRRAPSGPAPASSPPPAATKRRRSGSSPGPPGAESRLRPGC